MSSYYDKYPVERRPMTSWARVTLGYALVTALLFGAAVWLVVVGGSVSTSPKSTANCVAAVASPTSAGSRTERGDGEWTHAVCNQWRSQRIVFAGMTFALGVGGVLLTRRRLAQG